VRERLSESEFGNKQQPYHTIFGAVKSIKPGVNKDGYWVNDDVIAQVQDMLSLWEARHPDCTGVFMFDHSSNHMKLPDDALRTSVMNAGSGGTNRVSSMRDTTWVDTDGVLHVQIMGLKGLKEVLQERGLVYTNLAEPRILLDAQPDFLAQKPAIQEILESRGHIIVWCPKFHPEFNFIERYWGMVKFIMRGKCDYTFATLQAGLPAALEAPTIGNIRRFARKSADYTYAYQNGCKNPEDARGDIKFYKRHRTAYHADNPMAGLEFIRPVNESRIALAPQAVAAEEEIVPAIPARRA
jgi:hypothetical protein